MLVNKLLVAKKVLVNKILSMSIFEETKLGNSYGYGRVDDTPKSDVEYLLGLCKISFTEGWRHKYENKPGGSFLGKGVSGGGGIKRGLFPSFHASVFFDNNSTFISVQIMTFIHRFLRNVWNVKDAILAFSACYDVAIHMKVRLSKG